MNLDIVIPFFNEEDCIMRFCEELIDALDGISGIDCRYYLIDDGSRDKTPIILKKLASSDTRVRVITLMGNHGHQRALIAGLDYCQGDRILMMDGDGQHPIGVAVQLVNLSMEKSDAAILQAVRREGQGGKCKEWPSRIFYWLINRLVPEIHLERGSSDFRVIRKDVLNLIRSYPDRYRNLRVLLSTLRLPTVHVPYVPLKRTAGRSKYNLRKMLNLATDGIFTFSSLPLRLSVILMIGTGFLGFGYTVYGVAVYLQNRVVPGWTSVIALIGLVSSAVFAVLAIMAQYIRRIYEDVQRHPIYILHPDSKGNDKDGKNSNDHRDGF